MADIHFNGLKFAQEKGIKKLYQFDLYNPPFDQEFDVICLFDVLEHQKDDKHVMECLKKMLKPGGKILLTVPAHQWLWNRDDRINGHYRRYTKKALIDLCKSCGLESKHIEYFFIFIVPLLLARSYLNRDRGDEVSSDEKIKFHLSLGVNQICYALTKLEFLLAPWLPQAVGGSLFLMAEKHKD
jgi:SAM-dependent methyltransferase